MSSKRFTDTKKWRNPWFRGLPLKAKLVWIYICDECDHAGIWKMDLELASFQVGFEVTIQDMLAWFGSKVLLFGSNELLIVPFFGFQYGSSKDTWNAKVKAQQRLEALGFRVEKNEVVLENQGTVGGHSPDSHPTVLITGIVKGKGNSSLEGAGTFLPDLAKIYNAYPLKKGKADGLKIVRKEIVSKELEDALLKAIEKYTTEIVADKTPKKFIKHFSTFMGQWRDWLDEDAGTVAVGESGDHEINFESEAEIMIRAVKLFPAGSDKIAAWLGEVRYDWFLKIGRGRISQLPERTALKELAILLRATHEGAA